MLFLNIRNLVCGLWEDKDVGEILGFHSILNIDIFIDTDFSIYYYERVFSIDLGRYTLSQSLSY